MSALNRVYLLGNLTRDPDVRYTPKGTAVTDMAMAINEVYRAQDGQEREEVTYVDVVAWGRQAETCGQFLTKGSPVLVEGRLQLDKWEDKDGQKKSRLRVRADRVQFLGRPRTADGRESAPPHSAGERAHYAPRTGSFPAPSADRSRTQPIHESHPEDIPPHDEDVPF
jgi:single-strand DNA-binding protein